MPTNDVKGGYMKRIIGISVVMLIAVLAAVISFGSSARAQGGDCFIEFCKQAEGVEGISFQFLVSNEADPEPELNFLASGECVDTELESEDGIGTVIELPTGGWQFAGIECATVDGLIVTPIENGAEFQCLQGFIVETTCTIINVRSAASIPTLSEWGMIAAAGAMLLAGAFYAVRRRRAAA